MHFPIDAHLGCFHSGAITNKTVMNIFFFNPVTSELFIDLLPPKRCPASAALAPQNFGVIDLRHQFAVHNPGVDYLNFFETNKVYHKPKPIIFFLLPS